MNTLFKWSDTFTDGPNGGGGPESPIEAAPGFPSVERNANGGEPSVVQWNTVKHYTHLKPTMFWEHLVKNIYSKIRFDVTKKIREKIKTIRKEGHATNKMCLIVNAFLKNELSLQLVIDEACTRDRTCEPLRKDRWFISEIPLRAAGGKELGALCDHFLWWDTINGLWIRFSFSVCVWNLRCLIICVCAAKLLGGVFYMHTTVSPRTSPPCPRL